MAHFIYLNKLKDGKSRGTLLCIDPSEDAVELGVETAVSQAQQEATQQGNGHTGKSTSAYCKCEVVWGAREGLSSQIQCAEWAFSYSGLITMC